METEITENIMAKNQISFDFDLIGNDEKEESVSLPQTLIKNVNHDYIGQDVLFVVVKSQNKSVYKDLPSLCLCGKKMTDWVLLAGRECEQKVIEESENIFDTLKSFNTRKLYIAVFYSDTPLLSKNAFHNIMDYFTFRNMNFLRLKRGFVIKSDYLNNVNASMQSGEVNIEEQSLLRVDSASKINYVGSLLYERIRDFHIKNGVIMFGENTIFIDADVEIESGVVIYPNNVILGNSFIESGACILQGNTIKNSIISNGGKVENSFIEKSKITSSLPPKSIVIGEEK